MRSPLAAACLSAIFTLGISNFAFSDAELDPMIAEIEELRNSLPRTDYRRIELDLRLADLYFEAAANLLHRKMEVIEKDKASAQAQQRTSLGLYDRVLKESKTLSASLRTKIDFQRARILSDLGKKAEALEIFTTLSANSKLLPIRRESLIRVAEGFEKSDQPERADQAYIGALAICSDQDICSTIRYRRGWLLYEMRNLEGAIQEMKLALFDSKGQVRDESLRDYILFLSNRTGDGLAELTEIEKLGEKTGQKDLGLKLSNSFFSNGNREAGVQVLIHVNSRNPQFEYQAKLLEELYGLQKWNDFEQTLDGLEKIKNVDVQKTDEETRKDSENILKRLLVQLEGEQKTDRSFVDHFKRLSLKYIDLFPRSTVRENVINGILKSEESKIRKTNLLASWILQERSYSNPKEEMRLRQTRLSLAQELKNHSIVLEEARELAVLDKSQAQKYTYLEGLSHFHLGQKEEALKSFARITNGNPNEWVAKAQDITLDIHAKKKDYAKLVELSTSFGAAAAGSERSREFSKIKSQAQFEAASSKGESLDALEEFLRFCESDQFLPKSCENAKILAVKLRNQNALIRVLVKTDDKEALIAEYEASGRFKESADLMHKVRKKKTLTDWVKIALLYELEGDLKARNKTLKSLMTHAKRKKSFEKFEDLAYSNFLDAGLIDHSVLDLPWTGNKRLHLAHLIAHRGERNKKVEMLILSSKSYIGPEWAGLVLSQVNRAYERQRKQKFHGRSSKYRFNKRLKLISALKDLGEKHLEGSDSITRVKIAWILREAYEDLNQEILNTPIPDGLDAESVANIQASLVEMGKPFLQQAEGYLKLGVDEASKVQDSEKKAKLLAGLKSRTPLDNVNPKWDPPKFVYQNPLPLKEIENLRHSIQKNPRDKSSLVGLKDFYKRKGIQRLAAYYDGRIQELEMKK